MRRRRVLVCGAQVPYARGGAEVLVDSLAGELARRDFEVDVVRLPFAWTSRRRVLQSVLAWRLLDLSEVAGEPVDRVIATRFPSYAVAHPDKVVWLVHQYRQAYDLFGTAFGDLVDSPEDRALVDLVRRVDARALGEASGLFSISRNVSERLRRHNELVARPLYPPPHLGERYRRDGFGDYLFAVGRLDRTKRFDLLVRLVAAARSPVRAVIAGSGPEREALQALAERLGVAGRVELPGRVDDERLLELYAGCLAVVYAPFDEDYGYVTVEAMKSGKPVLTTGDAGGVLEFVRDGENGFVGAADQPTVLAGRVDELWADHELARRLGEAGRQTVAGIGWDNVVERLAGAASGLVERLPAAAEERAT